MSSGGSIEPLNLPTAERFLSFQDRILAQAIALQSLRWPLYPSEDPIWGLVRIVMAQQISTREACRIAERVRASYPTIARPSPELIPATQDLRRFGLPERRARCCINILEKADQIRNRVRRGETWESAVAGIKGIGPWTLAIFRIMVLRDPDVLPHGDVGLERAIANLYGVGHDIEQLAENWRPFRSVACWYLWRTLGNEQLG